MDTEGGVVSAELPPLEVLAPSPPPPPQPDKPIAKTVASDLMRKSIVSPLPVPEIRGRSLDKGLIDLGDALKRRTDPHTDVVRRDYSRIRMCGVRHGHAQAMAKTRRSRT